MKQRQKKDMQLNISRDVHNHPSPYVIYVGAVHGFVHWMQGTRRRQEQKLANR